MDQRRFISFLLLSLGIFLTANWLFPQPKRPEKPPAVAAKDKGKADEKAAAPAADAKKNEQTEAAPAKAPAQPPVQPGGVPAVAAANVPAQFVTLGSLDLASGYRMLVTLTNTGAAVNRAEMASPRYRDADDWSGYLGELELKKVADGLQVQVVGSGTPAAAAKIEVGDVIVGVGNPQSAAIKTVADFEAVLAKTKPAQEINLQVRHANNAPEARKVQLMRRPFAVVRPEIDNYRMRKEKPPAEFVDRPSFLLTLSELNGKELSKDDAKRLAGVLEDGTWELAAHDEKSAAFKRTLPELNLEIVKRYTLATAAPDQRANPDFPAYHLQLDVELRNTAAAGAPADAKPSFAYRLDGPTGMPMEGWWYARKVSHYWSGGSLRDVMVRFIGSSIHEIQNSEIAKGKVAPMGDGQTLAYVGVDGQYFSAMLLPQLSSADDPWIGTTDAVIVGAPADVHTAIYANATCRLSRSAVALAGGVTQHDSFQIFLGPKRPELLSQYYPKSPQWTGDPSYSLRDLIYYGWFGSIARAMLVVLHFFYSIVGNYGISIIMLTVLVRGLMFPISYKQTQNMAKIQALKPEMDRINEKYKSDMQKKSQATQELYRKHSINPLGGCLPLFLQMPVFVGLYRALLVDVELRQSPLFGSAIRWCSNLAAPDMFLDWSSFMPAFITQGQGLLGLGPYLNVLPLVTVVLFLVTQKMSMPEPTNEQAAMQQKMMKYMTVFMGLMFYKVASGLCLYFIASSLWGIAERKLLPKAQTADAGATGDGGGSAFTTGGKRPRGDGSNGSSGSKRPRKAKPKK